MLAKVVGIVIITLEFSRQVTTSRSPFLMQLSKVYMAREVLVQERANVALVRGPYKQIVKQSLKPLAESKDTLIIDAADVFNAFTLGSDTGLTNKKMFSPTTAFQLKEFVEEEMTHFLKDEGIRNIAILGVEPLFLDPNLLDYEYKSFLERLLSNIKYKAGQVGANVVILTFEEGYSSDRYADVVSTVAANADIEFNVCEMEPCVAR